MDLFAKDHPLEAAALRMQSAQPRLPGFVFESLPHTVRHRIYRELLLKPIDDYDLIEDPIGENRRSEHTKVGERFFDLTVLILKGANRMHPEIMRTNKKIHEEAAFVLYGENWFRWSLGGVEYTPMWQWREHESAVCPRHYSRLITKMSLTISNDGDGHDPTDAIWWTTQNLKHACKVLALNDFKILKVDFYNSAREMSEGERCLTPLKKCRAEKFLIKNIAAPRYAAKLKAVIEGPKDHKFWAFRKATEDELESNYEEPSHYGDEEFSMDWTKRASTWRVISTTKTTDGLESSGLRVFR